MAATQAYCVKCRKQTEIKDPQEVTMKNGRPATKGTCPTCGTAVFRIGAGAGSGASGGASGGAKASGGGASGGASGGGASGGTKAGGAKAGGKK